MEKPQVLCSEEIYRGRIFDVSLVTVREGEIVYEREIISHPGSAVIVPMFADNSIALVRQWRHPAQKYLLELPAGSLSVDEEPESGARRELEEEIGVRAGKIELLIEFYVSPGFLCEKMHVFLATDLQESKQNLEPDELLKVHRFSPAEIKNLFSAGEIEDAKTIIGLTATAARFGLNLF
jgi:8-oxo-dGTP pyrophosphatase MutT (NUDIX family)